MRVLQVSSARTFGGGERHVVDLCRGLSERGHEVYAALRPTSVWQDRLDFLPSERILQVSIRNSFGVLSAMRIADFVRENGIDIIHAHVARDYIPASIACLAVKRSKFVLTRHVMFPLKPFNRFALKNLSRAIGVSDAVGAELRKIFPKEKVVVINNGIALENYDVEKPRDLRTKFREFHNIPQDAPLVGTLGELKELKGQRDLVLAAHEIIKDVKDCFFVVVGQDNTIDRRFRRELIRLAKVMGLEERIIWLDWLEDTSEFFSAIDLFVSPSHSESFGLALLEAMAHGKAIVATETDGARQLLKNRHQLVPVKDPVKLARAISQILGRKIDLMDLGAAARLEAENRYSLSRLLDETISLYESVLRADRAAAG
jgi:L-malate glycosyltransferase